MEKTNIEEALAPIKARLDVMPVGDYDSVLAANRKWALVLHGPGAADERIVAKCADDDEAHFFANAPTDITRLVAAIEAVTALHRVAHQDFITGVDCAREECEHEDECPTESLPVCLHCWSQLKQIDPYFSEEHHVSEVMWPCPTVAALSEAWDEGWKHRRKFHDPYSPEFGKNPYEKETN